MKLIATILEPSRSKYESWLSGQTMYGFDLLFCGFDSTAGWWAVTGKEVPNPEPGAGEPSEEEIEERLAEKCTRCIHSDTPPNVTPDPCETCVVGATLTNFEEESQ